MDVQQWSERIGRLGVWAPTDVMPVADAGKLAVLLQDLGYTNEEIDGRSPRFLDAVVAWGDADALRSRVQEHLDAGATHVCIQALTPGHALRPDRDAYRALAPAG